jgi:precorrin-6B methylase 2
MSRGTVVSVVFALLAGAFGSVWPQALSEGQPPPYVGTPERVIARMLALAKVGPSDTVIDLGSGDGRIVIYAAARLNARGIGVEMMPHLIQESRRNARNAGVQDRTRFIELDARAADLREATVLTLYLGPELNLELVPRILRTMRPGSRVVSHDFAIDTWAPDAAERIDVPEKNNGRGGESQIFLFIVPANVLGRWHATLGEGPTARQFEFSLGQQFQVIEGRLHANRDRIAFHSASLNGEQIALRIPLLAAARSAAISVKARVDGDAMYGRAESEPGVPSRTFSARRISNRPDL